MLTLKPLKGGVSLAPRRPPASCATRQALRVYAERGPAPLRATSTSSPGGGILDSGKDWLREKTIKAEKAVNTVLCDTTVKLLDTLYPHSRCAGSGIRGRKGVTYAVYASSSRSKCWPVLIRHT